jgi:hypothetical protein
MTDAFISHKKNNQASRPASKPEKRGRGADKQCRYDGTVARDIWNAEGKTIK